MESISYLFKIQGSGIINKIENIFNLVSEKMRLDFKKTQCAIKHRGLKGGSNEETFRTFLSEYLPASLGISTGELVDANGNVSRQLDVIIYDSAKTPILYRDANTQVIPVECAYAVIEVKAKLDKTELYKTFENMKTVRGLEKTAFIEPSGPIILKDNLYGKEWDIWPINYYIFAYNSIKLKTLANYINEKHQTEMLPEYSRIDTICVLDKGVICNKNADKKIDALPEPGSELYICESEKQSILLFYTLISHYLNQARLPNFKFTDYLGAIKIKC